MPVPLLQGWWWLAVAPLAYITQHVMYPVNDTGISPDDDGIVGTRQHP
jgi:hypothetical protein